MNNDTSKFVDKYLNCENVYADHKNLRMFSQNIRLHTYPGLHKSAEDLTK